MSHFNYLGYQYILDKLKVFELGYHTGFQEFWSVDYFLFLFSSEKMSFFIQLALWKSFEN